MVKEISVNGRAIIKIDNEDIRQAKKLEYSLASLLALQSETAKVSDKGAAAYERFTALNGQMRIVIDSDFGEGTSSKIFGENQIFALGGGRPLWVNLYTAIIPMMKHHGPLAKKFLKQFGGDNT